MRVMVLVVVFNTAFTNSSVISWRSRLVEETGAPGDLSQVTDKLYHIMLCTSPWSRFELTTSVIDDTDCTGSCKSNYQTITTITAPVHMRTDDLIEWFIFVWTSSEQYFSDWLILVWAHSEQHFSDWLIYVWTSSEQYFSDWLILVWAHSEQYFSDCLICVWTSNERYISDWLISVFTSSEQYFSYIYNKNKYAYHISCRCKVGTGVATYIQEHGDNMLYKVGIVWLGMDQ